MKIIKQSVELINLGANNGIDVLKKIEMAGRTCYKSEDKITDESCIKFVDMLIRKGHESVLEHHNVTMKFITDRGVTHELVRHRIASYSQESTRYCNYGRTEIEFIIPVEFYDIQINRDMYLVWHDSCNKSEYLYKAMLADGATPQLARSVLNNSLKTEIIATMNLRSWRHFFKLRTAKAAHPQMQDLAKQALQIMKENLYVVFKDLEG